MKSQLFIPKKCKVGFNLRQDTYTGKLGYIIMHDGKVWRKESSWESWREKEATAEIKQKCLDHYNSSYHKTHPDTYPSISSFDQLPPWFRRGTAEGVTPIEFENVPTEGFVLNRKAGGGSCGWNPRQTYCRVYDPRGFEFEITIQNLLFILQETNSIKGKGLEGQFVYSWDKKDLVLLPVGCQEYKSSSGFTSLQGKKIELKTLVEGGVYKTKKEESVIYLGKFDWWDWKSKHVTVTSEGTFLRPRSMYTHRQTIRSKKKKLIFFNSTSNDFIAYDKVDKLAECVSDTPVSNYAELIDNYFKSKHGFVVSKLITKPLSEPLKRNSYNWVCTEKNGDLYQGYLHTHEYSTHDKFKKFFESSFGVKVVLKDSEIVKDEGHHIIVSVPKDELETTTQFGNIYMVNDQGHELLLSQN